MFSINIITHIAGTSNYTIVNKYPIVLQYYNTFLEGLEPQHIELILSYIKKKSDFDNAYLYVTYTGNIVMTEKCNTYKLSEIIPQQYKHLVEVLQ